MDKKKISKHFDYYYENKNQKLFESFHYITTVILLFFIVTNSFSKNIIEAKIDGLMLVYQWTIFLFYKRKLNYNLTIILYIIGIGILVNAIHYVSPQNLDSNIIWTPILIILGHFLGGKKAGLYIFLSILCIIVSFDLFKSVSPSIHSIYFPEKVLVFKVIILAASCILSYIVGRKISLSELTLLKLVKEKEIKNISLNRDTISLLSVLSHDISTPVSICQMYLSKYKKVMKSEVESIELLKVEENISKMITILDNIKDLSLIKFSQMNPVLTKVDLKSCIINELKFQRREIFNKSLIVNLEWDKEEDFHILANEISLTNAILRTVVSNAIRFNKSLGTLEISLRGDGEYIHFVIKNTGEKIPKAFFQHIFEVGHGNVLTGNSNDKGEGLGLPLCKEFLDKINSSIEICNQQDKVVVSIKFIKYNHEKFEPNA